MHSAPSLMDGGRQTYDGKIHQLVTYAVLLVGKNTIFKFPRLLFIHGGVPFLLAYTTFMISIVLPIMHLENTLSQFSGLGHLGIFDTAPVFRGLGYTMTYYFTLGMMAFSTESSYGFIFLVNGIQSPLPWADCPEQWVQGTNACYVQNKDMILCNSLRQRLMKRFMDPEHKQGIPVTDGNETVFIPEETYVNFTSATEYCINGSSPSVHFFVKNQVLRLESSQWDFMEVHPELAVITALLWLIIFTVARHGIHKAKYGGITFKRLASRQLELLGTVIMLIELAVFLGIYGMQRLLVDYYTMEDEYPTDFIRVSWAVFTPVMLLALLGVELAFFNEVQEKDGQQGPWHRLLGYWIVLVGTSFTITYACACLTRFYLVWQEVLSPLGTWKPHDLYDSRRYRRLLRQFSLLSKRRFNSGSSSTAQSRTSGHGDTGFDNSERREGIGSERSVSFAPEVPPSTRFRQGAFNDALARRFGLTIPPRPREERSFMSQEDLLQELASPMSEEEEHVVSKGSPGAEPVHEQSTSPISAAIVAGPVVPFKKELPATHKKKKGKKKKRHGKKPKSVAISSLDGDLCLVNKTSRAADEKDVVLSATTSGGLDVGKHEPPCSDTGTKVLSGESTSFNYPLVSGVERADEKDVNSRALVPRQEDPAQQQHQ